MAPTLMHPARPGPVPPRAKGLGFRVLRHLELALMGTHWVYIRVILGHCWGYITLLVGFSLCFLGFLKPLLGLERGSDQECSYLGAPPIFKTIHGSFAERLLLLPAKEWQTAAND